VTEDPVRSLETHRFLPSAFLCRMGAGAACVLAILASIGCADGPSRFTTASAAPPVPGSIAETHVHKCGACHTLPAPGSRTRTYLEQAFVRHRKRVRLDDEQWREMVDYLASTAQASR
jgi:hypothetical protein